MTLTAGTAVNWMFRDRTTGKLVIAQRPNIPLALWLVCVIAGLVAHPHGHAGTALHVVGTAAIVVWAADEVARGVNPWRRTLGAAVLAGVAISVIR